MKLQEAETANRRISNVEPQNVEGWFRFAQSFFKIDRIHPFDPPAAEHSLFIIRFFRVSFSIKLAAFQASGDAGMKFYEKSMSFL
jgi:hypothetical protein